MTSWTETALERVWRALANEDEDAWRLHTLQEFSNLLLLAGRSFPGNREAILIKLPSVDVPADMVLPVSNGFEVVEVEENAVPSGYSSFALVRSSEGEVDMFKMMAIDALRHTESKSSLEPSRVLHAFMMRVKDWQAFMNADRKKTLSQKAQVGLLGELIVLEFLSARFGIKSALNMWQGPFNAAQDFHFYDGAIEVKSTAASSGFCARINSIDQLDTTRSPLYLCALRFCEQEGGESLVDVVSRLRNEARFANVSWQLESLLFASRYYDEHAVSYGRTLSLTDDRCYLVDEFFPHLQRATMPVEIVKSVYDIDLETLQSSYISADEMLNNNAV